MNTIRLLTMRHLPKPAARCCWWCGRPLPKRRRLWCGDGCAETFNFMSRGHVQLLAVWRRDRGACALCHVDTNTLPLPEHGEQWEADHIVPVVEGGGVRHGMTIAEALANLRTLCRRCHKQETAALARRRAEQRRSTKNAAVPPFALAFR